MMASNKRGPPTPIGDTVLELGEIFVMRVPYDMSEQEGTDPGTWTTSSRRSPPHHPCVLILRSRSGSTVELEFFVLRSFGGREPREVTKRSLTANEFLPLPYPSGDLDKTPAAFGEPLCAPGLRTESQTWLLIHPAAISVPSHTKVKRFDPRIYIPRQEVRRVLTYRETLRSRVFAGHGPPLAPAPWQIVPNLSRTPTTRTYIPSGRRLASDGIAGQTGGQGNDRRSNVWPERGEESWVPAFERSPFWASTPRDSVTGRTGCWEIDRETHFAVPEYDEAEREEARLITTLERALKMRASASRDSTTGPTDGWGGDRGSNIGVAERREAERGEAVGEPISNRFEGPRYVGKWRERCRGMGGGGLGGSVGWGGGRGEGGGGGLGGSVGWGGGSSRRGGEGIMGGSQTLVSGQGGGSNKGQGARVARMEGASTWWSKETPIIFLCENPLRTTIQIPPEFADADWDDDHDNDWSNGLPLPLSFSQMIESEKRSLTTSFKADTRTLSIDEWLRDIS